MKKPTKKEIAQALHTMQPTQIFKVAKKCGVDVNSVNNVFEFVLEHAPSNKVLNKAYELTYRASDFKAILASKSKPHIQPIGQAIKFAKNQGKEVTSYAKVLIKGHTNWYWASAVYQHKDYNKSIAFEINEKNNRIANAINKYLGYGFY